MRGVGVLFPGAPELSPHTRESVCPLHFGEDVSDDLVVVVLGHEEQLRPREDVVEVVPAARSVKMQGDAGRCREMHERIW